MRGWQYHLLTLYPCARDARWSQADIVSHYLNRFDTSSFGELRIESVAPLEDVGGQVIVDRYIPVAGLFSPEKMSAQNAHTFTRREEAIVDLKATTTNDVPTRTWDDV
jgi:hypothetical protein